MNTIDQVSAAFAIERSAIVGHSRYQAHDRARTALFYILRVRDRLGWTVAGRLAGKDRSSVHNGVGRARRLMATDADFRLRIDALMALEPWTPAPAREPRHPAILTRRVKPKNEPATNDRDALMRFRGTLALAAALAREHPERLAA